MPKKNNIPTIGFGGLPNINLPKLDLNLGSYTGMQSKKEIERDSRRAFSSTQRKEIWAQQNGKCADCHKPLDIRTVEYDHVKPWADKGKTITENGAALCANCHKLKNHKESLKKVDKKRIKKQQNNDFGNPFKPFKI